MEYVESTWNLWGSVKYTKIESMPDEVEVPDKDFGFKGVNLRTSGVDFSDDELSDSE